VQQGEQDKNYGGLEKGKSDVGLSVKQNGRGIMARRRKDKTITELIFGSIVFVVQQEAAAVQTEWYSTRFAGQPRNIHGPGDYGSF
jgi:hypothetical protein